MAKKKKKATLNSELSSARGPSTASLQKKQAQHNRQLLKLISEQAELIRKITAANIAAGEPLEEVFHNQEVLQQITEQNKGPLEDRTVRTIFRELYSAARTLAKPAKAVYLGPQYSYSHLAAIEHFGESVQLTPVATIATVFEELSRGSADFGLAPIENSTDGRIADTLGMFAKMPEVRICGEVQLRIHHNLLAKCKLSEIREVCSKPQAISQCRDWLAKHLPSVKITDTPSTTAAAKIASQKQGVAAVASRQAGAHYGLDVIESCIEDNRDNITRFAVLGSHIGKRTGADKTSLMIELAHQSGALADVMTIFKRSKLNLTWIESFPIPGKQNEYRFFVELEGHPAEMKVKRALKSLENKTDRLDVLGVYAKTEPVD